ncbi:putative phosphopantothenoylcysteine decarboxylase protein [Erysiphe necator]|uniref:Putative phosphopantothenoylcysteine decarboxylase protein n=1 Tax=Uncinula necator TaxID=52586 RepID=A0A0B1PEY5_UNCNE|nr:putative phosphopantothenoylcysteine decarboxylase protein [Erysiphe necator]
MPVNELTKKHVLIGCNGPTELAESLIGNFKTLNNFAIEIKAILNHQLLPACTLSRKTPPLEDKYLEEKGLKVNPGNSIGTLNKSSHRQAYELCQWTDLLVLAPIDADTLAKMLQGICDNLLLSVLRGWDISKKIILVPAMTVIMWENPMTKIQINHLQKSWPCVQLMPPILWSYKLKRNYLSYVDLDGLVNVIKYWTGLVNSSHSVDMNDYGSLSIARSDVTSKTALPAEIWTLIFEFVGDWEISRALKVYTNISIPTEWQQNLKKVEDKLETYNRSLELIILSASTKKIIDKLNEAPDKIALSALCVKLVIKFSLVDVLTFLATSRKDILWTSFGRKLIPTMASAVFGKIKILDWWLNSASFPSKDYSCEAMDGASKMGFIHVLEWWRRSNLPLKYTEVALEQASAKGYISVLDWWSQVSNERVYFPFEPQNFHYNHTNYQEFQPSIPLLPGKSLITAAQNNQAQVLRWWDKAPIPIGHSESVARVASQYGNVEVLDAWLDLKGEKMSFDSKILIEPTKNGHINVLQWWKDLSRGSCGKPGRTIQYKTFDIEEALEDSTQNEKTVLEVKKWWAQNELNLGLRVQEWTRLRTL